MGHKYQCNLNFICHILLISVVDAKYRSNLTFYWVRKLVVVGRNSDFAICFFLFHLNQTIKLKLTIKINAMWTTQKHMLLKLTLERILTGLDGEVVLFKSDCCISRHKWISGKQFLSWKSSKWSQRMRWRAVNCCLLDMTRPLHAWAHSSYDCLHWIKSVNIPTWTGKKLSRPLPLPEEVLIGVSF